MTKIGIITSTVRSGRASKAVADWVKTESEKLNIGEMQFEIVDLETFDLPVMGAKGSTEAQNQGIGKWLKKLSLLDGFIFVTAEYNHGPTGVLKNALDYVQDQTHNNPAAFVGYGGLGGARAIEGLRTVLTELQVANVQKTVNFLLATDFENYSVFKPNTPVHLPNLKLMLTQLNDWTNALKTIRK